MYKIHCQDLTSWSYIHSIGIENNPRYYNPTKKYLALRINLVRKVCPKSWVKSQKLTLRTNQENDISRFFIYESSQNRFFCVLVFFCLLFVLV